MLFQNMSKVIGRPASFEGLAEEAIELAEAALIASEESDDAEETVAVLLPGACAY